VVCLAKTAIQCATSLRMRVLRSDGDDLAGWRIQRGSDETGVIKYDVVCAPGFESNFSEDLTKWRFRTRAPELRRTTQVEGLGLKPQGPEVTNNFLQNVHSYNESLEFRVPASRLGSDPLRMGSTTVVKA
jgi:hypothetical protein